MRKFTISPAVLGAHLTVVALLAGILTAATAEIGTADALKAAPLPERKAIAMRRPDVTKTRRGMGTKVTARDATQIRVPPIRRVRPTMPPKPAKLRQWLSRL
ncbi:MAG: hypothetical protein AAFQ45_01715 [Pseudomonadota bacterium]